jgi:hypothetical protein
VSALPPSERGTGGHGSTGGASALLAERQPAPDDDRPAADDLSGRTTHPWP